MEFEKIYFDLFGLHLQEPMALITNWLISFFCFYAFLKVKHIKSEKIIWWKRFFLMFSLSTFFGGLGHLFFLYFDIPGKFPNWTMGILAGIFAGKAVLVNTKNLNIKKVLTVFLWVKGILFLTLAIYCKNFLFIAIDAIVTYILYTGLIGYLQMRNGIPEMKYMVIGVIVTLPSAFIFLFKLNPHRWLNKDDLSHIFMLGCTIFFFIGVQKLMQRSLT